MQSCALCLKYAKICTKKKWFHFNENKPKREQNLTTNQFGLNEKNMLMHINPSTSYYLIIS